MIHFKYLLMMGFAALLLVGNAQAGDRRASDKGIRVRQTVVFSGLVGDTWQVLASGPPFERARQVTRLDIDCRYPSWAPDAKRLVFQGSDGALWLTGLQGAARRLPNLPKNCKHPGWSPDGRKIVFAAYSFENHVEASDLWVYDLAATSARKLMTQPGLQSYPSWSPDGKSVLYTTGYRTSPVKVVEQLWIASAEGGTPRSILATGDSHIQAAWSPDGRTIVYASDQAGNMDIWLVDQHGKKRRQLTFSPFYDGDPAWSSDGRWICFVSARSGKQALWRYDLKSKRAEPLFSKMDTRPEMMQPALAP